MKIDVHSANTGNVSSGEAVGTSSQNSFTNVKNFSDLKPGDRFKAVVTDITPNHVTLRLASGNSLTAKSLILPEARIGEESIFAVKENFKGQILLEMMKPDNTALQTNIIKEALSNASLVATKENMNLVADLIGHGISIDSETLNKAAFFNYSKGDVSPDKVLFLLKEGFEANTDNMSVLTRLMNKSLRLENSLKDIITGIIELDSPDVKKDLINILLNKPITNSTIKASEAGSMGVENSGTGFKTFEAPAHEAKTFEETNIDELIKKLASRSPKERSEAEKLLNNEISKRLFIELKPDNRSERKEIGKYFTELTKTVTHISERLKTVARNTGFQPPDEALISDLKNISGVSVTDKLTGQIAKLDGLLENITENVKFMNQINNYKEYMQIPFSVAGEKNQGELYIFKNKTGSKNHKEQASVLIAVDFDALGRVECFINKASNNLSFDFRLEDDNILGLVKKNTSKLFETLTGKGYKIIGINYKKIENETTLTSNPIKEEKPRNDRRYAFDMRV